MRTYKWTCLACKSPNILVHDESKVGQIALNCDNCGEAGQFEARDGKVLHYEKGEPFPTGWASTSMTAVHSSEQVMPVELSYLTPNQYNMKYKHRR